MRCSVYRYLCSHCGTEYKNPRRGRSNEFIFRTRTGKYATLDPLGNETYHQFGNMVDNNDRIKALGEMPRLGIFKRLFHFISRNNRRKALSERQSLRIFQMIFPIACDLAPDGSQYVMNTYPACPKCGHNTPSSWGPTNPPEAPEIEISPITHNRWNKLSEEEKKEEINTAIENFLAKYKPEEILEARYIWP